MANTIKKLEKENVQFKQKWENSNFSAIALASEVREKYTLTEFNNVIQKAKSDEQINLLKTKIDKLENLCRALQNERTNLKKALCEIKKSENVDVAKPAEDNKNEEAQQSVPVEQTN